MKQDTLRVGVTGASGFLGSELCRTLATRGMRVIRFSRNPSLRTSLIPGEETPRVFSPPSLPDLSGLDAIIHLAGESILGAWTAAKKRRIYDSRITGTRAIVTALREQNESCALLCASATGYYGDRGEEVLTEDSSGGEGFLASVCLDWEAETLRAKEQGRRVGIVRLGMLLDSTGGAMQWIAPIFRAGFGGKLGSGKQWMPLIHRRDAVAAFLHLLENASLEGTFNAVTPQPCRNEDFTHALARSLGCPSFLPAPAFALRLGLGDLSSLLLASQRVQPCNLLKCGFSFTFPDLKTMLSAVFPCRK